MREIDHIVYCVPDLEQAINNFHEKTGTKPIIGGRHLKKGTRNALVNLGNKCYLEFLAIDKDSQVAAPRWMGIDLINEPTITRWSLKSTDLEAEQTILNSYNPSLAAIEEGERITAEGELLKWQMTLPISTPEIELVPFMTDWSQSDMHPTDSIPLECELLELQLYAEERNDLQDISIEQLAGRSISSYGEPNRITIKIKGPKVILEM